jgi:hypothetical protein
LDYALNTLDRTIFYSVPFKVPALNGVTGGGALHWCGEISCLNRHGATTFPQCEPVSVSLGKGEYSTDGTLVRQSAPLTFDEVTPALPDSIYGYMSGSSDTFGIHQFGRRSSTTAMLLVIRPSSPVTSDIWRPVWSFIPMSVSFYDITVPTERGMDEPEHKKRRRRNTNKSSLFVKYKYVSCVLSVRSRPHVKRFVVEQFALASTTSTVVARVADDPTSTSQVTLPL